MQGKFQVVFEPGLQILGPEMLPGEAVQPSAQLGHVLGEQRKPNCMGVATKANEQFGTVLKRFQQMKA